jgi:hypothetical protein
MPCGVFSGDLHHLIDIENADEGIARRVPLLKREPHRVRNGLPTVLSETRIVGPFAGRHAQYRLESVKKGTYV